MNKFCQWVKWQDRNKLNDIEFPGIYCIALSHINISSKPFNWRREIIYIGMTNSKGGLKARLGQFDSRIKGKAGRHVGARRIRLKYSNYNNLKVRLYVSVFPTKCDVNSKKPKDLRLMGFVARKEYECFAEYVEVYGELPEFNNSERSPKK